ncbi:YchJ family protein [Psychrobacter frigidicola]|uniref:YchJ family protein n=1 Tax=Psychrobacter frigidicola TaxID=45611 RepID=A0A5C7A0R0_9GAMM|nr:YchJ family protein [Psychrobacter frigidicola]TXD96251.1 YchJ family protein [Psychrobacter frigidicola]
MPISTKTCPCQILTSLDFLNTPVAYSDCCQPYHDGLYNEGDDSQDGVQAESAERLMRTRYSAFVLVKADYIVKTTVPAQQALLDSNAIESWAKETDWAGLEIIRHTPKLAKRHAQVEFKAYFNTADGTEQKQQAHRELSTFVKVTDQSIDKNNERWYFLDPTVSISVTQKQPCICGSGEKFKHCCGVYIS